MARGFSFIAGGTLPLDSPSYVARPADAELLQSCLQGEFAYVLSSRQMGKSSLLARTRQALADQGVHAPYIDLTEIGSQRLTADQWYVGVLNEIESACSPATDLRDWWASKEQLPPTQRFSRYFSDVLLPETAGRIVVFVDEIDSTLNLDFTDDFFASIRASYNRRAQQPDFARLSFVLVGVATPAELIRDRTRTPFNIGRRVDVTDFTREEAQHLVANLGMAADQSAQALEQILYWTGGQPYLTQRLCMLVAQQRCEAAGVRGLVESALLSEAGRADPHFQFIEDYMRGAPADQRREVFDTYADVCAGKFVPCLDLSAAHSRLRLAGIVKRVEGQFVLRNEIYRHLFGTHWLARQRRDLQLSRDLIGRTLRDRYHVVRRTGEDAVSDVYLAEDASHRESKFVLKVLKAHLPDPENAGRRIQAEARALQRFEHPGIVKVHECFEEGGVFFEVLEHIEGRSLADLLDAQGAMKPAVALPMFEALLDALEYAHQAGVIHGDVKPDNVLIDDEGRPHLSGFGGLRPSVQHSRQTGLMLGTPHFMSPEQIQSPKTVDHRSDLYSAGIVLYEMLTGTLPFGAKETESDFETLQRQVQSAPPDPRLINPRLDADLARLLLKALRKDPARRYQGGAEFRADIDRALKGTPAADSGLVPEQETNDEAGPHYKVYAHPTLKSLAVRTGFCWPAFFFGAAWLLSVGLYRHALLWFAAQAILLGLLVREIGADASSASLLRLLLLSGAASAVWVLAAVRANRWREERLRQRGYVLTADVTAPNARKAVSTSANVLLRYPHPGSRS